MLEQNNIFFIASAAVTSSASIVDGVVSPCGPKLKLTGAFEDTIQGHRLAAVQVVPPVCIRNCSQLKATLHVHDGEIHSPGQVAK